MTTRVSSETHFSELAGREFLHRVTERLTNMFFTSQSEAQLAELLLDAAAWCAGAKVCCVLLKSEEGGYQPLAVRGLNLNEVRELVYRPEPGMLWQMLATGEPLPTSDAAGQPMFEDCQRHPMAELRSQQWIPLRWDDQVQGLLTLSNPVTPSKTPFLVNLCQRMGWAWHRLAAVDENRGLRQELLGLQEELRVQAGALALTEDWNRILSMLEDRYRQLDHILCSTVSRLEATKGSIMLVDDSGQLVVRALCGVEPEVIERVRRGEANCLRLRLGEGVAGHVALTGRPLVVNQVEGEPLFLEPQVSRVSSILCLPLEASGLVLGVLNVTNKLEGTGFTSQDVERGMEMATRAAHAIHQSRLYNLAVRDASGIYVRSHLFQRMADEVTRARRYQRPLSLLSVGLVGHAQIRTSYGHDFANRLDDAVVTLLACSLRDTDLVGRLGSESIGILLPETEILEARFLAERLVQEASGLNILEPFGAIFRVGLCSFPDRSDSAHTLAMRAEQALAAAGRQEEQIYLWPLPDLEDEAQPETVAC